MLLALGLGLVAVAPFEAIFCGSAPVVTGNEFEPTMSVPLGVDKNNNGVEDGLDSEIAEQLHMSSTASDEYVNVTVLLMNKPSGEDVAIFSSSGGTLTTELWTEAVYGFGGRIPYSGIISFITQCSDVLLIEKEAVCNATVAYATRQVGARPYVWSTLGLQGDPNASLAVLDTGIDSSHVDFAPGFGSGDFSKKIVGWNDQVTSSVVPFDDNGHGSHCSGLAAGDGFFSVDSSGYATATWGANLGAVTSPGTFLISGMMLNNSGAITVKVKWTSTGTAALTAAPLYYGDKTLSTGAWSQVATVSTPSQNTWYTLTYNVVSVPSGGYDMYHPQLTLSSGTGNLYVTFTMSWPYVTPSDGFSAWKGMASESKLVGVKVLDYSGSGSSTGLINGINWIIANRVGYHITVASMSLGFSSEVTLVDTALVNLVNSGVSTIVSAGNSGSGTNRIYTPGSVDEVLTVASVDQFDGTSSFSSQGGTSRYTGKTVKPDITAPGGSFYAVPLFSADTNYNDADGGFSDVTANDAAPMQGTSMSCPVVSGAAEIVVQAIGGYSSWSWTRNQALMPKTLLLMTATETYPNLRETSTSTSSPTLNRGGKDVHEGYGRLNVDAAADAVLKTYIVGTTVSDSLGSPPSLANIAVLGQRLAWARNVQLSSGTQYNFSLAVPSGADYDLYLYNITGNSYGEPVIVNSGVSAATGGFEKISYTPSNSGEYYLVVKRAREDTGAGQFTLISTSNQTAHLMLYADPDQAAYVRGQSLILKVTMFNGLDLAFGSVLTITVTGPSGYSFYDFQPISATANSVGEYSFTWNTPNIPGTYVVEAGLAPSSLTAYDVKWVNLT